jgi:hypothetical protein
VLRFSRRTLQKGSGSWDKPTGNIENERHAERSVLKLGTRPWPDQKSGTKSGGQTSWPTLNGNISAGNSEKTSEKGDTPLYGAAYERIEIHLLWWCRKSPKQSNNA